MSPCAVFCTTFGALALYLLSMRSTYVLGGSMMCESADMMGFRMMGFDAPMIAPMVLVAVSARSLVACLDPFAYLRHSTAAKTFPADKVLLRRESGESVV